MNGELGDWRVTNLAFERSRIRRSGTAWRAAADWSIRMARLI